MERIAVFGRALVALGLGTACVDNGNDVGFRLPHTGSGTGGTESVSPETALPPCPA